MQKELGTENNEISCRNPQRDYLRSSLESELSKGYIKFEDIITIFRNCLSLHHDKYNPCMIRAMYEELKGFSSLKEYLKKHNILEPIEYKKIGEYKDIDWMVWLLKDEVCGLTIYEGSREPYKVYPLSKRQIFTLGKIDSIYNRLQTGRSLLLK